MRKIYKVVLLQDGFETVGTRFFTTAKDAMKYGKTSSEGMSYEDINHTVSVTYKVEALRKPTRQKEWVQFINLHGTVSTT